MGYELRRWLADRLPPEVSSGERLLALEIADLANDRTRRAFGSDTLAKLLHRSGFADMKQVGKVLGKLATRGLELRAPIIGKDGQPVRDKAGRLVFAAKGHGLEFVVPTADCPALQRPPAWGSFDGPPDGGLHKGPPNGRPLRAMRLLLSRKAPPLGRPLSPKVPPLVLKAPPPGPQRSPRRGTLLLRVLLRSPHLSHATLTPQTRREEISTRKPTYRRNRSRSRTGSPPASWPSTLRPPTR